MDCNIVHYVANFQKFFFVSEDCKKRKLEEFLLSSTAPSSLRQRVRSIEQIFSEVVLFWRFPSEETTTGTHNKEPLVWHCCTYLALLMSWWLVKTFFVTKKNDWYAFMSLRGKCWDQLRFYFVNKAQIFVRSSSFNVFIKKFFWGCFAVKVENSAHKRKKLHWVFDSIWF